MLDKKVLGELEEKLNQEKSRLEKELSSFANPVGKSGEYETRFEEMGTDKDENASEVEAYSDNVALENNLEGQLKEIVKALERMKTGTYGFCQNCGKEVSLDRLKAYPAASTCIQCK